MTAAASGGQPVHCRLWPDIDPRTLHDLVRLRIDVFVVEQACRYSELDGRDVEPGTLHLWTSDASGPTSYLRLLTEPSGDRRIGRVATRADARGRGLARRLVEAALARCVGRTVVLDAQSHLTGLYSGLGFVPAGPQFVEDGIPHVPMRREPSYPAGDRVDT